MPGVTKVSVSLPTDVLAEVRERVGPGGVSAYVADVLRRDLAVRRLADVLDDLDAEHGPVSAELLAQAEAEWP